MTFKELKNIMEKYSVGDNDETFCFQMYDFCGKEFDNKEILDKRLSLVLIKKGTGIADINGISTSFIAPCIFCVNEKEHFVIKENEDNEICVIYLHPSVINSVLDFNNSRNLPEGCPVTVLQDKELLRFFFIRNDSFSGKFGIGPITAKRAGNYFDAFSELIHKKNYDNWPCRSRSNILSFLFLLENLYNADDFAPEKSLGEIDENIYPILLYIYHNYDKKITVADITTKFFVSRSSLSKMFQENLSETFLSYLNKLRITMASTLLRDTLLPVNEVMAKVGFFDAVHFFRTYKKQTGLTPTEYRDKYGWI